MSNFSRNGPLACLLGGALLLCSASAQAGTLYFSQDGNFNGLYALDTSTAAATLCGGGETNVTGSTVGLAPGPNAAPNCAGDLYGSQPFGILEIQGDGSGATTHGSLGVEGMAYDALAGTLYGAINGSFFSIDPGFLTSTALAAPGSDIEGLAWDRRGGIFGLDADGDLKHYDIALNTWSLLGTTGIVNGNFGAALAYDAMSDLLYAMSDESSNLYSINPVTALATLIGDTGLSPSGGGLAFVAVPLPLPGLLLLTGLGGLVMSRRTRKS